MTLYRTELRQAVVAALQGATAAGQAVYDSRDWPVASAALPAILVLSSGERKESRVRGVPTFTTTSMITVIGRVTGPDDLSAEAALDTMCEQIEQAVLANPTVVGLVQQFSVVHTELSATSNGKVHTREAAMTFGCEFLEVYTPNTGAPFLDINGTVEIGAGISIDVPLPQ